MSSTKTNIKIEKGMIIQLGSHRLACGDSTDTSLVERLLGEEKIDLILTDPPYGVAYVEGKKGFVESVQKHKKIANDQRQTEASYEALTKGWLNACVPHLARKNAYYIFNADVMLFALQRGLIECGFKFQQLLVWVKSNAVMGRLDYLPQHELIAYGWRGVHAFYKAQDSSLLMHPRTKNNVLHPTMKPVPLLRRLILNSSQKGGIVYDPFGGSGSTLIACEQAGRSCRMVELDPDYCQKIVTRWERLTGHKAQIRSPKLQKSYKTPHSSQTSIFNATTKNVPTQKS